MGSNSTTTTNVLTLQNRAFCAYLVCSCILVIKMLVVAMLTARQRFKTKSYPSMEDVVFNKAAKVETNDAVERLRRVHLNDLENIPIFWAAAFAYLFTRSPTVLVCILFFTFTVVRIGHTIVYGVVVVRQPTRAILFLTGVVITLYMTIHALIIGLIHLF